MFGQLVSHEAKYAILYGSTVFHTVAEKHFSSLKVLLLS